MAQHSLALSMFVCGILGTSSQTLAQTLGTSSDQVMVLERQWADAIQQKDVGAMSQFLSDRYALTIGVQGQSIKVVPRVAWLDNLKNYEIKSFSFDDYRVQVYGDTAIVFMIFTQEATVRGQDRSAQFVITDVWIKEPSGWRVVERHSSRPEAPTAARPH